MIITRFHDMEKVDFSVEFLSPTFLGGADQNAELRSPPFKNLFRQWWRVAHGDLDVNELRIREGELFGTVMAEEKAVASKVRLSIFPAEGFQISDSMPAIGNLMHPQVKAKNGVDILLYLGYGPVNAKRTFINPGSRANIVLYCPKNYKDQIIHSLSLAHHLGSIGGRSRNGYGSVVFIGSNLISFQNLAKKSKNYNDIMHKTNKRYPSALSSDAKGVLCWEYAKPGCTWQDVFKCFSKIYMGARLSLRLKNHNVLEPRHIMGYPAGKNHKVEDWGWSKGRMPSQLRLMVKRDDQGQMIGRILHLPHPVPKPWDPNVGQEMELWKKVHEFLDGREELKRCGGVQ